MRLDDETTASQLHVILARQGFSFSLSAILRFRSQLGLTFRGSIENLWHELKELKIVKALQESYHARRVVFIT